MIAFAWSSAPIIVRLFLQMNSTFLADIFSGEERLVSWSVESVDDVVLPGVTVSTWSIPCHLSHCSCALMTVDLKILVQRFSDQYDILMCPCYRYYGM